MEKRSCSLAFLCKFFACKTFVQEIQCVDTLFIFKIKIIKTDVFIFLYVIIKTLICRSMFLIFLMLSLVFATGRPRLRLFRIDFLFHFNYFDQHFLVLKIWWRIFIINSSYMFMCKFWLIALFCRKLSPFYALILLSFSQVYNLIYTQLDKYSLKRCSILTVFTSWLDRFYFNLSSYMHFKSYLTYLHKKYLKIKKIIYDKYTLHLFTFIIWI